MKKKCYNCKFAGTQFKIEGKTYLHCEHPRYSSEKNAWETLREFHETCDMHEAKTSHASARKVSHGTETS